jgi:diguanylate cyclase (GGDEF)-like protein/PAS domain S-box-containing protein
MHPRDWRTIVFAVLAVGAAVLLGFEGWLDANRPVEFCSLVMTAIIVAAAAKRLPSADRRGAMSPAFVVDLATLVLIGSRGATLAAGIGALMKGRVADRSGSENVRGTLADVVTALVAIQAAAFVHAALGGTLGGFVWPMQAVPVGAAVAAYLLVSGLSTHIVRPLAFRRKLDRGWPMQIVREAPAYLIGAAIAVAVAEAIDHRFWQILPLAAVPLFFVYRAYANALGRDEEEHRVREIVDEMPHGMCVVDAAGRVTFWNDAMERLVCPRDRVFGSSLVNTVATLRDTPLPKAMADAVKDGEVRTVPVAFGSNGSARTLDVKIRPVHDGVALLWQDVTDRTRAEQVLQRTIDRLTLAADGASDALWEWDLRSKELYVSTRWKALLGLPESADVARIGDWIDRVHADDVHALNEAIKAHLEGQAEAVQHEHRIRHEDGTYRWFLCSGRRNAGRRASRIAGSLGDITDRIATQERLRTAAFLDPLTGLRNRPDFIELLGRRLEEFKRRPTAARFAVLYLDLDRFKVVNDSLGHLVGDELLVAVSRRLESCLREHDCIARLGGDEFVILLHTVHDELQANAVAFRIQDALKKPMPIAGRDVFTSASIGIAVGRHEYTTPDEIMRDADSAMYHAKQNGKARHELFDAEMHARARGRLSLESDLRIAVESNDFEVNYQPIVVLSTGMCIGFESLIRWTRPNGEKVSPAVFIPMAEELGVIDSIGTWVLNQACRQFADWQRRFPDAGLTCITVNASSRQLTQQTFPNIVEQALQTSGLEPQDLRIEVTETALMDAPQLAAQVLSQLRDFGIKIYLDDFGTGCSSLSHLHKLPVDALKVDRSFVQSLLLPDRPAIVESILALARTLKTSVVAEGIEDEVQARELERLGCTHAQGYLFSRPLAVQAAEALIAARRPLGPKGGASPAAFGRDAIRVA